MPRARTDADVLKALSHPLRRQIMTLVGDGVASPKELAATLGEPIPNVSYHVGILRDLGLIKVVRETPRRGAIERHYAAVKRSLSVREVIDWLLAADHTRPRGWDARVVELDDVGQTAVKAAVDKFWDEVAKAEKRTASRKGDGAERYGVAVLTTPTASR